MESLLTAQPLEETVISPEVDAIQAQITRLIVDRAVEEMVDDAFNLLKFDEGQPRDPDGRWASGGGLDTSVKDNVKNYPGPGKEGHVRQDEHGNRYVLDSKGHRYAYDPSYDDHHPRFTEKEFKILRQQNADRAKGKPTAADRQRAELIYNFFGSNSGGKKSILPLLAKAVREIVSKQMQEAHAQVDEVLAKFNPDQPRDANGRFGAGDGSAKTLSSKEFAALQKAAAEHIKACPRPSAERIAANRVSIANSGRAGGDFRGSSKARAVSRQWLLDTFGDGKQCGCVYCGIKLDDSTITRDKIYTGDQGGRYDRANILPACIHCNQSRNNTSIEMTTLGGAI